MSKPDRKPDAPFGPQSGPKRGHGQNERGIRTRILLVSAMAFIIVIVTSTSLLLVRHRLRLQVTSDLAEDLAHSVTTFQNLQLERMAALQRENALLADLPSLKALMTTSDALTIQNGAVEFWKVSGNDLFALADAEGNIVASDTKGSSNDSELKAGLHVLLAAPEKHYLVGGGSLFACSVQPLYFGSKESGTLLGYVISGIAVERSTLRQISGVAGAEAAFVSNGRTVASTIDGSVQTNLAGGSSSPHNTFAIRLGNARYLATTEDLSSSSTLPLQLVVLKSYGPADRSIQRIDRLMLIAGLVSLFLGCALMVGLSRVVTEPIEELAKGVRAFGEGDGTHRVPRYGTYEVRQLSAIFAGMRDEIQRANRALLESERLATIGRMASSVSHDLRHYLASVYANAEFLSSDRLSTRERAEIFADITAAVHGTTEMIESLLVFSRTGLTMGRSIDRISTLMERAVVLVRAHPDAEAVTIVACCDDPAATAALVDGKEIERAICNLLLNACQSARMSGLAAQVSASLEVKEALIVLRVGDNGAGVPDGIRKTLFDPFVSEGKQKGTGLGLTLAHRIAEDHGGGVSLLSSSPGETIFQMTMAITLPVSPASLSIERSEVTAE